MKPEAQRAFTAARAIEEKNVREQPDYAPAWSRLGLIDAGLGRKEEAIREGRRAWNSSRQQGFARWAFLHYESRDDLRLDRRKRSGVRSIGHLPRKFLAASFTAN